MQARGINVVLLICGVVAVAGCASSGSNPAAPGSATDKAVYRVTYTPDNNPTTTAGRGAPSLDDPERPAAWILVDGKTGNFIEREGHKPLQWVVAEPVTPTPTFRVEGYRPLLGEPRDFRFILKTVASPTGSDIAYAVSASKGTFNPGQEYSLLRPGENFLIRNWTTGDVVREIAPLPPGEYLIAADVRNHRSGKAAAAVTYFTVSEK